MVETELRRSLGLTSAITVVVGGVIGSGIFLKPLDIARSLPSPGWIYGIWAALGVICLFGAFAYAELGTMFPEAGGQYAFLREGYGRFTAFLYGWCLLFVINSGTIAALAVAFASSIGSLVPLSGAAEVGVAAGMIALLAGVNHFGVGWGAVVQNVSTFAKLVALGAIALGGFLFAGVATGPSLVTPAAERPDLLTGLVTASVAIFWAYEGWYQLPFSAAELRRPERDLPRGLIIGIVVLVITYVSVNAVYLHLVPIEEMRALSTEIEVPKRTIERTFGLAAGAWLSVLVCISVFGAANPNLLSTPRAIYAMAKDGLVPRALMRLHPVHRTPSVAIWFQATWAMLLVVVLKTFRDITEYVVFAALLFYALTVAALYVLRRREPKRPRPFRCVGYPVTPALFILVVLFVDVWTLADPEKRTNALVGLGILAAGVPVFAFIRRGVRGRWRA